MRARRTKVTTAHAYGGIELKRARMRPRYERE